MIEYKVVNLLNGAVTIIIADNIFNAIKKGSKYFSEPNRSKVPVQVFN